MAAAQSTKQLATKLGTLANTWVHDPFRPNIQMSTFLQSLARHPRLTPQAVQAVATLHRGDVKKAVRANIIHAMVYGADEFALDHTVSSVRQDASPTFNTALL
ncbi:hypothetical protein NMY22_g1945 [Coprinellus aureogranulatus]|nr:hypothetical protein NMY22_g1945 [Coprinellus aureogranulatus]